MGWLGRECPKKPATRELNEIVDQGLSGPDARIIDKSGWLGYGGHRFTLMELEPGFQPEEPRRQFIFITLVEYSRGELRRKSLDEGCGICQKDCPLRLIEAVQKYPPINELSERWRREVTQYHQRNKILRKLLRKLREEEPGNSPKIVLTDGREVEFYRGRYRSKLVDAYIDPEDRLAYKLSQDRIDLEATETLRGAAR